jgi:predicted ribosome quality control (RQC) complex YloA/Tae2 family protein
LNAAEIQAVTEEIVSVLIRAPVQKVVQADRFTVMLGMKTAWLVLSADPRLGRLHLLPDKPPGSGEAAPPFCMQLRKELVGARLESMNAVRGERVVELGFVRAGERRRLRLFLFGRAAQLVLLDEEKPIGALGPAREIRGSLPPPRDGGPTENRFGERPSVKIAAHYAAEAERTAGDDAVVRAEAARRAARKKLDRLAEALARDLANARGAAIKRKWADLLLAHLAEVPRGASSVTLPDDFEGGAPIVIPLSPQRSAKDNAQRLYTEHKRLTRAAATIERRLEETRQKLAQLDAAPLAPLPAATARPATRKKSAAVRAAPYREFKSLRGRAILVGRGADRNDELTFQVARGNDLWLHARDVPGAHVVVPLEGGKPVDEETLVDAATLAAHHSNARGEAQVDVSYTLRKHVRKPPRTRPGLVTLSEAKTLRVRVEPDRLARLLASRVDDET